jgi:hypothetical protein
MTYKVRWLKIVSQKTDDAQLVEQIRKAIEYGEKDLQEDKVNLWLDWLEHGVKVDGEVMTCQKFLCHLLRRRQGDVLIEPIPTLTDAQLAKLKRTTQPLALGEASGHHHLVTQEKEGETLTLDRLGDDDTTLYLDPDYIDPTTQEKVGRLFLRVKEGTETKVQHLMEETKEWTGEHHPIDLVPGHDYEVKRPTEYTPTRERRVFD